MTTIQESTGGITDAGVIADLADEANGRTPIDLGGNQYDGPVAFVRRGDQTVQIVDLEQYGDTPTRRKGQVAITDHGGLIEYVNRHKVHGTTLWGNYRTGVIVAVFDDHEATLIASDEDDRAGRAGWGQHRATFTAQQSEDWKHWVAKDGRMMSQTDFAEHIEDGVDAIRQPSAADMLEIAQFFQANNRVAFKSAQRLDNGETQLLYEETVSAKVGQKGTTDIPSIITLGLPPFDRTDPYKVEARFRYRINDGVLLMGYKLIRPDKVLQSAFDDIARDVEEQTGLPVIAGTPRS